VQRRVCTVQMPTSPTVSILPHSAPENPLAVLAGPGVLSAFGKRGR
jgi:hypothetical protein